MRREPAFGAPGRVAIMGPANMGHRGRGKDSDEGTFSVWDGHG